MTRLLGSLAFLLLVQDPSVKLPSYPPEASVRTDFLRLLDRPRVPLDPRPVAVDAKSAGEGLVVESLTIATERHADGETERVPVLIVRPALAEGKLPVVIALHGTGGNKEGMLDWLSSFARRGMVGVAIDARHHGARKGRSEMPLKAYNEAIIRAWKADPNDPKTFPFYFDTCWDVWRTIDYLETRPEIDPARIGLFGISKGGIETWLAGSVDQRVKVAVPAISVQSFRWSLDHEAWQGRAATISVPHRVAANDRKEKDVTRATCEALWEKIIPGILGPLDCPSMLRLFAGRPMLIVSGEKDPNCPIGGARVAVASAQEAYARAGSTEKLDFDLAVGAGHSISDTQKLHIYEWFSQWLKAEPAR